jgi:hypothetical protein
MRSMAAAPGSTMQVGGGPERINRRILANGRAQVACTLRQQSQPCWIELAQSGRVVGVGIERIGEGSGTFLLPVACLARRQANEQATPSDVNTGQLVENGPVAA